MLPLFSIRVAELPPAWGRAIHSVYSACLSWTFISLYMCFFSFWFWGWDVGFHSTISWSLLFHFFFLSWHKGVTAFSQIRRYVGKFCQTDKILTRTCIFGDANILWFWQDFNSYLKQIRLHELSFGLTSYSCLKWYKANLCITSSLITPL